ncbi:DUF397 domain-containing protein [Nocardiopsis protaetiae]|uniref:DUF397 domain-containing protein n=1 Tax=Nocardiopsis protaetiae TaxID=3382270 RepID=UPI00387B92D2
MVRTVRHPRRRPHLRTPRRGGRDQDCVEVAVLPSGTAVRDSENPDLSCIAFSDHLGRAYPASVGPRRGSAAALGSSGHRG